MANIFVNNKIENIININDPIIEELLFLILTNKITKDDLIYEFEYNSQKYLAINKPELLLKDKEPIFPKLLDTVNNYLIFLNKGILLYLDINTNNFLFFN